MYGNNTMIKHNLPRKIRIYLLLVSVFSLMTQIAYSQETESANQIRHIGGGVTVTNNGISLLPTFTLGKPAAIFDLSVGGKKLSFDPQFRMALEGKPWSFIFWWRYKLLNNDKFRVQVGAHPAIMFRTVTVATNGESREIIEALRFVAGEFSPNYNLTKNISIGMYYLYGHGFQNTATQNTHFVTLNSFFSNIRLSEKFYMKFYPQVYYLRMDAEDGFYITASLSLARRDFPLSIQAIVNQPFTTTIPGGDSFVWNLSLIYAFHREYVGK
jgi:hypothetical protein